MSMSKFIEISKVLSPNDTGETNSHQAGILIPKDSKILSFFPGLGCETKNPRKEMMFSDHLSRRWFFNFIYYNNRFFDGTRNEYRLTGMTRFIHSYGLKAGDEIFLARDSEGRYNIRFKKNTKLVYEPSVVDDYGKKPETKTTPDGKTVVLKLGTKWKVISV